MSAALFLMSLVLLAEPRWEPAGSSAGVHWYTRERAGLEVRELRATALFAATPTEVWAVLTDFEGWVTSMPSTDTAVVVAREGSGRTLLYLRYVLPLIAPRDTLVEMTEHPDVEGRWLLSWQIAPEARDWLRPVPEGVVRLRLNEGLWQLEARDGGRSTFVTYQLLSTLGGGVPPFFERQASALGVPRTFEALRTAVHSRRAAK
jgi:hypothetical protein